MSAGSPEAAVRHLARGGLVAYPTETVWGLGAAACSAAAVARLQAWKGRDDSQPISILVAGAPQLEELAFVISPLGRRLMNRFWPGALTLVMPCRGHARLAPGIAGRDGGVGVRVSPHPGARDLVEAAASAGVGPITTTSLNRSGEVPASNHDQALRVLASNDLSSKRLDCPLMLESDGKDALGEMPSTVLDLTGPEPRLLRVGRLAAEVLAEIEVEEASR